MISQTYVNEGTFDACQILLKSSVKNAFRYHLKAKKQKKCNSVK